MFATSPSNLLPWHEVWFALQVSSDSESPTWPKRRWWQWLRWPYQYLSKMMLIRGKIAVLATWMAVKSDLRCCGQRRMLMACHHGRGFESNWSKMNSNTDNLSPLRQWQSVTTRWYRIGVPPVIWMEVFTFGQLDWQWLNPPFKWKKWRNPVIIPASTHWNPCIIAHSISVCKHQVSDLY